MSIQQTDDMNSSATRSGDPNVQDDALENQIQVLSEPEPEDRYTRIRQLGWNRDYLRNAYALVVGAGALGNEVLKNLALVGWGHILVVDMDTIDDTNLTRSVLFRKEDAEQRRSKAEVAAERVREINPDVQIIPFVSSVQEALGLGVFRRMDVVFGCLDNRQARLDINRACFQVQVPYIDGGLNGINGDIHVFLPPFSPCYGCTLSSSARQHASDRHQCLKVRVQEITPTIPTAPTISSIIAGWQTQIGIKLLHGNLIPIGQRIALFGGPDRVEQYQVHFNPACEDHADSNRMEDTEIVRAPFAVRSASLRDLLEYVRGNLGLAADTLIQFDFDLLLTAQCPRGCESREFYQRLSSVWIKEIVCPQCGSLMNLESEYRFDGTETYVDKSLEELGVPPMHILTAVDYEHGVYQKIELSDDFRDVFLGSRNPVHELISVCLSVNGCDCGEVKAPWRVSLLYWLLAQVSSSINTENLAPIQDWRIVNLTQDFEYQLEDSLLSTKTKVGDRIGIQITTT